MNKNTFYAVVVVYNTYVDDSITLTNIENLRDHIVNVIVVDNSIKEMGNKERCHHKGWKYISMNGNAGLSKAYNAALDCLHDASGVVIWFDDDTEVTQQFFDVLDNEVTTNDDIDIFTPMIQGQDGRFWSPNEYHWLKNRQLKNRNQKINDKRFNAINSCTAVRLDVYKEYRYTEKLFLDQVDHQFFEDQREIGRKFKKIDVIIHHNFSTRSKMSSIEKVKNRYSIMIPDFLVFCNKSFSRRFLGWIKIMGWGVREGIKYKNPGFFVWCVRVAYAESKKRM